MAFCSKRKFPKHHFSAAIVSFREDYPPKEVETWNLIHWHFPEEECPELGKSCFRFHVKLRLGFVFYSDESFLENEGKSPFFTHEKTTFFSDDIMYLLQALLPKSKWGDSFFGSFFPQTQSHKVGENFQKINENHLNLWQRSCGCFFCFWNLMIMVCFDHVFISCFRLVQ